MLLYAVWFSNCEILDLLPNSKKPPFFKGGWGYLCGMKAFLSIVKNLQSDPREAVPTIAEGDRLRKTLVYISSKNGIIEKMEEKYGTI
jgi:hypothetical protein